MTGKFLKFLKINYKDDKRLERLKNTVNKYMADIRPDRLTTCQVRKEVGRAVSLPCHVSVSPPYCYY
jgi:hypothetical protein